MSKLPPAEYLLPELGVSQPSDIDLEVIAWHLGLKVKYRELTSCEARIVALGDRGIITIDKRKLPERQRFSLGHELGHWHYHRGKCLVCRSDEIGGWSGKAIDPERVADAYASDLLMPWFLFKPALRTVKRPSLALLRDIKTNFSVQLPITGYVVVEVEAADERAAIKAALASDVKQSDIEEWETHECTNRGNVAYGSCTEANAELIE